MPVLPEDEDLPPDDGEGMDEPPCDPEEPPEGMLEELPPDRPDDPPELPELPPEEGGELDGLGMEDEDCCSGQPPMRNTEAALMATSLPRESRRLRR